MPRTVSPALLAKVAAGGVFAAAFLHSFWLVRSGFLILPLLAAVLAFAVRRNWRLAVFALGFTAAFASFDAHLLPPLPNDPLLGAREIEATITKVQVSGGNASIVAGRLQSGGENLAGSVLIQGDGFSPPLVGERVNFLCNFAAPSPWRVQPDLKIREAIRAVCAKPENWRVVKSLGWSDKLVRLANAKFTGAIRRALPSPQAELGAGLLFGSVGVGLPQSVASDFRLTGTTHIVAASGYNVSVVAIFCAELLFLLGLRKRWTIIAALFLIWFYVALAGAGASVVRAGVMASLVSLARLFGRQSAPLHALTLAGAGMLILNPLLLAFDVGFELSFAATFGLVGLGAKIAALLPEAVGRNGFGRLFLESLAASLATLPIIAWRFGTLSLISLPANLAIVAAVPWGMALATLGMVGGFLPNPLSTFLALPAWVALSYILNAAHALASLPFASLTFGKNFPWYAAALFYAPLVWFVLPRRPRLPPLTEFEGWDVSQSL